MVYGIGTDILNIGQIRQAVSRADDPFIKKTYTKKELDLIYSRPSPLYCFATRFAGKEAVFKSLGVHGNDIRLNEIEILELPNGAPFVRLSGRAEELAAQKNISHIHISLSYDTDYALAFAQSVTD